MKKQVEPILVPLNKKGWDKGDIIVGHDNILDIAPFSDVMTNWPPRQLLILDMEEVKVPPKTIGYYTLFSGTFKILASSPQREGTHTISPTFIKEWMDAVNSKVAFTVWMEQAFDHCENDIENEIGNCVGCFGDGKGDCAAQMKPKLSGTDLVLSLERESKRAVCFCETQADVDGCSTICDNTFGTTQHHNQITVILDKNAAKYFADVHYSLDKGDDSETTESDVINHCLQELMLFEQFTDDQLTNWLFTNYPEKYSEFIKTLK
jgi:hypothetical protein